MESVVGARGNGGFVLIQLCQQRKRLRVSIARLNQKAWQRNALFLLLGNVPLLDNSF
jgi:hypothetical protein